MLNLKLKNAICLFIGVALLIVLLSFADELPPVSITASHGGTYPISSYAASHAAWNDHENRLSTANQELQKLRYERDIIDAAISGNRTELKKFKTVTILVAGRKIGFAAAVNAMVDLLDNSNTYEMELQRISKYSEIRSQNNAIANAASDRDAFHTEFVKRWHHEQTHITSQENGSPPDTSNPVESESIPMLGAACKNTCGVFWYDKTHVEYYSGFSGGISAFLGWIPGLARSSHRTTCMGTVSCGVGYWTCEGNESGGTARHKLRTCKIQGRQWNSGTSSYDTVTCNMDYRNCDNPGGRCFNGSSAGHEKHNDDVSGQNSYASISPTPTPPPTPSPTYHACEVHETSVSGDHSLQASCSSTDSNGNYCTVTNFYACDGHTHVYPAPPTLVPCSTCQGSYDPNDASDVSRHTVLRPCIYSGCGVVFYVCSPEAAGACGAGYSVHYAGD